MNSDLHGFYGGGKQNATQTIEKAESQICDSAFCYTPRWISCFELLIEIQHRLVRILYNLKQFEVQPRIHPGCGC